MIKRQIKRDFVMELIVGGICTYQGAMIQKVYKRIRAVFLALRWFRPENLTIDRDFNQLAGFHGLGK